MAMDADADVDVDVDADANAELGREYGITGYVRGLREPDTLINQC